MFYRILLFLFFHLSAQAADKWPHDYYESEGRARNSKLDRLHSALEKLSSKSEYQYWEIRFIYTVTDDFKDEDFCVVPDLLHDLFNFSDYISERGIKTIYYLTREYLAYARKQNGREIKNFAKALNALHHLGVKLSEYDYCRNDIVEFIEKNLDRTADAAALRTILISSSLLHVSLSTKAEELLAAYVKNNKFGSRAVLTDFFSILAHYRLYMPKRILYRYFELPAFSIGNEIFLLWSLAISALNDCVDIELAQQAMDLLFEIIAAGNFEMTERYLSMINFSISSYKTLYKENPNFVLITQDLNQDNYITNSWDDLIRKLQKRYPDIEFEKEVALIGAPVDAYLERYGQRFVIQFDGPTHFLLENNSRNKIIKSNGSTRAQTELLLRNNYLVMRIDYLFNEDGYAYDAIKRSIKKYKPKKPSAHSKNLKRKRDDDLVWRPKKVKYEYPSD